MSEAPLEPTPGGLGPAGEGWFVVNVRDGVWVRADPLGAGCVFEWPLRGHFAKVGFNIRVIEPGQPAALYHSEAEEEHFLVLSGRCLLLVEEVERELGPWDFAHCPPGTAHTFVGLGSEPCLMIMVGSRGSGEAPTYPVSALALRHGVGVEEQTSDPQEAFAAKGISFAPGRGERRGLPWDDV